MKVFLVRVTVSLQAFKDNLLFQTLFIGHGMVHRLFLSVKVPMFKDKASMSDDIRSMSGDIGSLSQDIQSMFYDIHSMPDDIASMFNDIHSMSYHKGAMSKDIRSLFEDIDSLSDDIAFRRALWVSDPLVRHSVRHFLLYLLLQYLPQ